MWYVLKRLFIATGIFFIAVFLFLIASFFVFPNSLIESWLENELNKRTGFVFSIEGFQKSFPLSLEVKRLNIAYSGDKSPLFYINNINGRFLPSSLLSGNIRFILYGDIGDGHISEEVIIRTNGVTLNTVIKNAGLKDIPYFNSIGLYNGIVNGKGETTILNGRCIGGFIKAEGGDIDISRLKVQGLILPIDFVERFGITTKMEDCKIKINGLWLEGEGVSARLQGLLDISTPFVNSPIDLTLEITPKASILEKEPLLLLIKNYRRSLNYYSIPIKGTIGNPIFVR
jgi:type II secretion system protein N